MFASFAKAVRGGGPSLAGKPSEDNEAGSGKADPLEATLRCPKTLAHVPVLRALISRCGPDAIACVRSISATNFAVTCRSDAALVKLLEQPSLDVEDARCFVSRAGEHLRSITLRAVPFDACDGDLRDLLLPFATLIDWSHETYADFPKIATGNRRLHVKMEKPLPNFLTFRKKRVVVSYAGVRLLCFKCGSPDHAKKECPKTVPAEAEKPVDPVQAASEAMPPPENKKKVSKRKKMNASPVPSQSPSPRSRKRQHAQSQVVTDAGHFSTPTASPSTRRARSASNSSSLVSDSPSRCSPASNQESPADAVSQSVDFHQRILTKYILKDDEGWFLRPHVVARWIHHWCEPCWTAHSSFKPDACKSTPKCDGRFVTDFGLPTTIGQHMLCLSTEDEADFCLLNISSKGWNVCQIDNDADFYHGVALPEYASAPLYNSSV